MSDTPIVSVSGYAGVEPVTYINRHPHMNIAVLAVLAQGNDVGKLVSDLYPQLKGIVGLSLRLMSDISESNPGADVVFLTTAHEVSHDLASRFLEVGCVVSDLFDAFRASGVAFYGKYYGFTHQYPELSEQAAYGLAEWRDNKLREANLIAVPGCYPTAAQLALKLLINADLLDLNQWSVINATSDVSGVGCKVAISNSLCEISLRPYAAFTHRHQPETTAHPSADAIFTPHLGSFPCDALETITRHLGPGVSQVQVAQALQ